MMCEILTLQSAFINANFKSRTHVLIS